MQENKPGPIGEKNLPTTCNRLQQSTDVSERLGKFLGSSPKLLYYVCIRPTYNALANAHGYVLQRDYREGRNRVQCVEDGHRASEPIHPTVGCNLHTSLLTHIRPREVLYRNVWPRPSDLLIKTNTDYEIYEHPSLLLGKGRRKQSIAA